MAEFLYTQGDEQVAVQVEQVGERYRVTIDERCYEVAATLSSTGELALTVDGKRIQSAVFATKRGTVEQRQVWLAGQTWSLVRTTRQRTSRNQTDMASSGSLTAGMPGQVREILVTQGDIVTRGDPLVILEAMKMEMRLAAPADGTVGEVHCAVGEVVEQEQRLVTLV